MSTSSRRAKAPSYRHHKPSGRAFIQLNKRRYYLPGKFDSAESREAYARFLAEHWAPPSAEPPPAEVVHKDLSVVELIDRYWQFAEQHYVKHGEPTGTLDNIKPPLRRLKELYGSTPAARFGPLSLKALRQTWISDKLAIKSVNHYTATVKAVFGWGVSEELLPPLVHHALKTVQGLRRGRSQAREPAPVGPVADDDVERTLPHLPAPVAAMVQVQKLTGMRPGEVRIMRPCDIDRRPDVWRYTPGRHKMEHRGRERVILLGPKAQGILAPLLLKLAFTPEAFCFATATGRAYSKEGYNTAIERACERAFGMPDQLRKLEWKLKANDDMTPEQLAELRRQAAAWRAAHCWSPNQLRHNAATAIRKACGTLEKARVVLGHAQTSTTEIYAEKDLDEAASIMRQIG